MPPVRAKNAAMKLSDIRIDYRRGKLRRSDLKADPVEQFSLWMEQAQAAGAIEPTAMSLATVGVDGRPRVRTVLLKGLDARGFVFFTNLESRKGRQLEENPHASLLFAWLALERQAIISGPVEKVSREEADAYFASRPRESQLAAWTSAQSRPVASREALEAQLEEIRQRFADAEQAPLPPFWGGYRVRPETIEFWQGGSARLHDRFEYRRQSDGRWSIERLAP
jgi:pyridoxamine 5'-phosphate oxidase